MRNFLRQARDLWLTTSDLKLSLRLLARYPGTNVIASVALAIGIGLTVATFGLLDGLMHGTLPFEAPQEIVSVRNLNLQANDDVYADLHEFTAWREQQTSFQDLAAFFWEPVNFSRGSETPTRLIAAYITPAGIEMMRAPPLLGRLLSADDDRPGAEPAVVIAHQVWITHFGADPDVLGSLVRVAGETLRVVGVMPEGFRFPYDQDLWMALRLDPLAVEPLAGPPLRVFGRLKIGITAELAEAELRAISRRLDKPPGQDDEIVPTVVPYADAFTSPGSDQVLWSLLSLVILILIVACANVGNLLLVRSISRAREIAVRASLGASRLRLISQLVTEALVLAALGAALGAAAAHVVLRWFEQRLDDTLPFWASFGIDADGLLFVTAVTCVAGAVAGIAPAVKATGESMLEVLQDSLGGTSMSFGRLSSSLVIAEVALSVAFLAGAATSGRNLLRYTEVDCGLPEQEILTARISLRAPWRAVAMSESVIQVGGRVHRSRSGNGGEIDARRQQQRALRADLEHRLLALAEVREVAFASALPGGRHSRQSFEIEGRRGGAGSEPRAAQAFISSRFFDTLEVSLIAGRGFSTLDGRNSPPVAVVNESLAGICFPGENPIGRRIRSGPRDPWVTIVGLVRDLGMGGDDPTRAENVYRPLAQVERDDVYVAIRTAGNPLALSDVLRDQVAALQPDAEVTQVMTLEELGWQTTLLLRTLGGVLGLIGGLALFLALAGLYAVMAFTVTRRTREIGIRMALGAASADVLRWIFGRGMIQMGLGVVLGGGMGLAVTRVLVAMVPIEIDGGGPVLVMVAMVLMILAAAAACWVPAWRALRIDPVDALRFE